LKSLQLAIGATASAAIRKRLGIRPTFTKSIHLPWFAQQTASPLVLCTLALVMSHGTFPRFKADCDDYERSRLRFLGDHFSVFPNVDRPAVHTRGLARDLGGAAQKRGRRRELAAKVRFSFGPASWSLVNHFRFLT